MVVDRSLLEIFEQKLIEKYKVQIHMHARIAFAEDRFWDVTDKFSPVGEGIAHDAFYLFIDRSKEGIPEKDTFRTILDELNLVDDLIEVTHLKNENLMDYLHDEITRNRYVKVDYAIIGSTFAQICKFGVVSDGFMKLFIISILRQLNPVLIHLLCEGDQDKIEHSSNLIEDLSKYTVNIVKAGKRG